MEDYGTTRVWESLSLYESTTLVKTSYQRRHGKDPTDDKTQEIVSLFTQGHEYFRSAAGAGRLVRPLILYYGAMALARGLVLFSEKNTATVKGTHGLKEDQWQDLNAQPHRLPEFKLTVSTKGTFPSLCRVTGNAEANRIRATGTPQAIPALYRGTDPITPGTQFTIKEVLSQIPDLAELYESTFDEFSNCLLGDVRAHNPFKEDEEGSADIAIFATPRGIPDRTWVSQKLGRSEIAGRPIEDFLYFAESPETQGIRHFSFSMRYQRAYEREPHVDTALGLPVTVGRRSSAVFVKLPTSNGMELATLPALYMIAFATGMLVRYHPGYWMAVASGTSASSMAPILSAASSVVEELFPRLVLEELS